MSSKGYYLKAGLLGFIVSPIAITAGTFAGLRIGDSQGGNGDSPVTFLAITIVSALLLALIWHFFSRKAKMPDSWGKRLAPIVAVFGYYSGLWALALVISNYSYGGAPWDAFFLLTMPYFLPNLIFAFSGDFSLFPVMSFGVAVVSAVAMVLTCRRKQPKAAMGKGAIAAACAAAALCLICGFQYYLRTTFILASDWSVDRVEDEINYYDYTPFSEGNLLVDMPFQPTLSIDSAYPHLDGATAAYPVYAAMAQGIYKNLDESTVGNYVECTTTSEAYRRLIAGEIDIFFGAQPSGQQMEAAKAAGLELDLLPVAKEAFVFFVNAQNPVNDLTLEQIQGIYTKEIKNWSALGGLNEAILPFQRPENSGSQTIMQAVVMRDIAFPAPLREEYAAGMGGVISRVATYRNYSSSIGYSFRYFATGMRPNESIKLISINGIEPSVENIRSGGYPFTVDVYAVTAGPKSENTQKLLDWLVSEQGQALVELCGYVRR